MPPARGTSSRSVILIIAFALFGGAWLLFADKLWVLLFKDPVILSQLELAKGWFFIIFTAVVLEVVLRRNAKRMRKMEILMQANELQSLELVEHVEDVLWIRFPGANSRFIYVNPSFERVFGRPRQVLYDDCTNWLNTIHVADRERVASTWASGDWVDYGEQYRVERPDGSYRWVQDRAYLVTDEDGKVIRVCGIAQDITNRLLEQKALEDQVAVKTRGVTALLEVGHDLASTLEFDELLERILERLKDLVDYSGTGVILKKGDQWIAEALHIPAGEQYFYKRSVQMDQFLVKSRFALRQPLVVQDLSADAALRDAILAIPGFIEDGHFSYIRSWMAVPLVVDDEIIGALLVDKDEPDWFTGERQDLVKSFAGQVALALKNAGLYQNVQARLAEMRSLQHVTTALLETRTLDQLLEIVCLEACQLTSGGASAVFTVEDGKFFAEHQQGVVDFSLESIQSLLCEECVGEGEFLCNDPVALMPAGDTDLKSLLIIPLRLRDEITGALCVANKQGGFSVDDVRILSLLGDAAVMALNGAQLTAQAQELAVVQERQRLALELHDAVSQALFSSMLYSDSVEMALAADKHDVALINLNKLQDTIDEAMKDMRMLVFELRPPALDDGLVIAIEQRLAAVEGRVGLQTEIRVQNERRLPPRVEKEIFGIIVEALNNIIKHAKASDVLVNLRYRVHDVEVEIVDDGVGFDVDYAWSHAGMGLPGMRERARSVGGELGVESAPADGTRIRFFLKDLESD